MKALALHGLVFLLLWGAPFRQVRGEDMRVEQQQATAQRNALMQKAAAEVAAAEREARESRANIFANRASLETAIAELESDTRNRSHAVDLLTGELTELRRQEAQLDRKLGESDSMIRELVGMIRINANDINKLITRNLQTALGETISRSSLKTLAAQSELPGMEDVRTMVASLWSQIRRSKEVTRQTGPMVDRAGREVEAEILAIGPFTAAYQTEDETGFLSYSAPSGKLYALSHLPSGRVRNRLKDYLDGKSDVVPMDISRGAALRQLTHQLSLWDQIPQGGPIVWPILAILLVGLSIVLERTVFLYRKRLDADSLILQIEKLAFEQQWSACEQACQGKESKPTARVLRAGLLCRRMPREEIENALQEAILKEAPRMERFLSTLGMLAAIAPLLGLLGTVTGMIDTFHIITLYGTGDPRLMSGGISEALVTTMLGLSVAIPLLLAQTLLNRTVDNRIGEMEEKSMTLVNIVQKVREAS
jgi:biopolymer transport protein ExbB